MRRIRMFVFANTLAILPLVGGFPCPLAPVEGGAEQIRPVDGNEGQLPNRGADGNGGEMEPPHGNDDGHGNDQQHDDPHNGGNGDQMDNPDPGTDTGNGNEVGEGAIDDLGRDSLTAMLTRPREFADTQHEIFTVAIEAVIQASILGGGGTQLVTTGTLVEGTIQQGRFRYLASPTNLLLVELANGRRFSIEVDEIRGNLRNGADSYLYGDHEAVMRIIEVGNFDLVYRSTRTRDFPASLTSRRVLNVVGQYNEMDGVREVDTTADTQTYFENSAASGLEQREQIRYTGRISGAAVAVEVDENWDSEIVSIDGTTVTSSSRRINNRGFANGEMFEIRNGLIRIAFRDGRPNEVNTFWEADGVAYRDGAELGPLTMNRGNDEISVSIGAANAGGESLLSWRR